MGIRISRAMGARISSPSGGRKETFGKECLYASRQLRFSARVTHIRTHSQRMKLALEPGARRIKIYKTFTSRCTSTGMRIPPSFIIATNNPEVTRVTLPVDKFYLQVAKCNLMKSEATS